MTMTKKSLIPFLAVATALVGLVMLQPAEAGPFNEQVSGNFIDTAIDTNGDGTQANYFSGVAKGNGSPTYEGLVEIMFGPTGLCDADELEGTIVEYSIVRRYSNGDLAFSRLVDGSLCFDPGSGLSEVVINAEVTGGTGRYAQATGTYTAAFTVKLLVPDPLGGIGHGAFYGDVSS